MTIHVKGLEEYLAHSRLKKVLVVVTTIIITIIIVVIIIVHLDNWISYITVSPYIH